MSNTRRLHDGFAMMGDNIEDDNRLWEDEIEDEDLEFEGVVVEEVTALAEFDALYMDALSRRETEVRVPVKLAERLILEALANGGGEDA